MVLRTLCKETREAQQALTPCGSVQWLAQRANPRNPCLDLGPFQVIHRWCTGSDGSPASMKPRHHLLAQKPQRRHHIGMRDPAATVQLHQHAIQAKLLP
jgi:hypothetical protein